MSCQICGQRSAPGSKLCADCRAARKRAYDPTITQPLLAMAGAGTISRTLSRLRRSDSSPEAKARRAARKAKAAAESSPTAGAPAAAASVAAGSRPILWALLAIGVVVAGIAGWHLPSRTPSAADAETAPTATPAQPAPDAQPARMTPSATTAGDGAAAAPHDRRARARSEFACGGKAGHDQARRGAEGSRAPAGAAGRSRGRPRGAAGAGTAGTQAGAASRSLAADERSDRALPRRIPRPRRLRAKGSPAVLRRAVGQGAAVPGRSKRRPQLTGARTRVRRIDAGR